MGCARLVRPPGGQEANPGAVQPGHDPVDDDRDRDGRKHECAQDRPGVRLVLGDQETWCWASRKLRSPIPGSALVRQPRRRPG
ncbi:MAG: hypothetical protein K0S88_3712 [Actinomycetia bacterium]|jgi:hypothetical protein|nr:hypothetical protein [Actinomycetes bacterium]